MLFLLPRRGERHRLLWERGVKCSFVFGHQTSAIAPQTFAAAAATDAIAYSGKNFSSEPVRACPRDQRLHLIFAYDPMMNMVQVGTLRFSAGGA